MRFLLLCILACCCVGAISQESTVKTSITAQKALRKFNSLVGSWRGVGQVRRGSRAGAWVEKTTVAWDFEDDAPAVQISVKGGRQFDRLRLQWDEKTQEVVLLQSLGKTLLTYRGRIPDEWKGRLEVVSAPDTDGFQHRCTIQQLSEIRTTVLLEKRSTPTGSFRRIAAVGYTRAGEQLAIVGGNRKTCVVTGGLGTIQVTHQGETYYVCCEGCLQAFNAAPDAVIADYTDRLAKQKRR